MFDSDLPVNGQPLFGPACGHPNCHKKAEHVLYCSRCQSLSYCSKECQLENFQSHKKSCKDVNLLKQAMKKCLKALGASEEESKERLVQVAKVRQVNAVHS